jgi:hypothetical protein
MFLILIFVALYVLVKMSLGCIEEGLVILLESSVKGV